jgi:RNA recognition motif-containing protein
MSDESEDDIDRCNVFIKYLPPEVTDTGLYAMFSPFGEIISCKVMVDTLTGNSLGYGFCRFSTKEEAKNAIQKMSGTRYGNKTLLCKYSNSASVNNSQPSDNLYIKPLLPTTTEEELREIFSQFGIVKECKVMINKNTGTSRQIGLYYFLY